MENYVFKEEFLEENKQEFSEKPPKINTKPSASDCFFKLLFVNTIVCAAVVITALVLSLCAPKMYSNIRNVYLSATQKSDITLEDFKWAIDRLSEFLFTPKNNLPLPASSQNESGSLAETESGSIAKTESSSIAKTESYGSGGADSAPDNASLNTYALTSKITAPTSGSVTSYFGKRIHPIFKTESFHSGLDIANKLNTPVCSAFSGKVLECGTNKAYGNYIIMRHSDNLTTFYGHLNSIKVKQNMNIRRGEIIGYMGSTGYSTGPHLHFEIRINQRSVDPAYALKGNENIEF